MVKRREAPGARLGAAAAATDEDMQLLAVRGLIAGLPARQQAAVRDAAALLRGVIAKAGEAGVIALALVGCEQQTEPAGK